MLEAVNVSRTAYNKEGSVASVTSLSCIHPQHVIIGILIYCLTVDKCTSIFTPLPGVELTTGTSSLVAGLQQYISVKLTTQTIINLQPSTEIISCPLNRVVNNGH